ncbi:hypothetical protein M3147_08475 [Agromyces mediolanus]|uniref:hypothetical protein n=1 Tax=Agromyces mediolanus TaxID=41986 RepID=UPI00203D44F2|nr:hypothetical protein [Agromyces mediolanus]MCM3657284.1 hypothetical protein [Agromyces mediolanus]
MMHEQLARWFDEAVERMRITGSFFETDHVTAIDGIPDSPDIKTLGSSSDAAGVAGSRPW